MHDINEFVFWQLEHCKAHLLHIIFLQILQNNEQLIQIKFLHELILHIIKQFEQI